MKVKIIMSKKEKEFYRKNCVSTLGGDGGGLRIFGSVYDFGDGGCMFGVKLLKMFKDELDLISRGKLSL